MSNDTWISGTGSLSGVNPEWSFSVTLGEKNNEFKGQGNSYTTEFRQYDARVGRLSATADNLNPLMGKFPWQSPYVAFVNNSIRKTDPDGKAPKDSIKNKDGKYILDKNFNNDYQVPEAYIYVRKHEKK